MKKSGKKQYIKPQDIKKGIVIRSLLKITQE